MKHSASRDLFAHWNERRGMRALPERGEIEPAAIRAALGDTFILGAEPGEDLRFRLAGTRVCALFGRELKSEAFLDLWDDETRAPLGELLGLVADETTGVVAAAKGRTGEGWAQDLELMLLPLAHRGSTHARMIGTLAPLAAPFWLGVAHLGSLTLGNVRHLDPRLEAPAAARLVAGTRRPLFTVHEGGRV